MYLKRRCAAATSARHSPMRLPRKLAVSVATLLLAACASFGNPSFSAGAPPAAIIAALGTPTARYDLADGYLLEYRRGPWGQQTYMARFDRDDRLVSYEQVLNTDKFASIKINVDNKDDVLRTIGAPSETTYLSLVHREVWSYPYRESNVWNSLMHVYFDNAGIVRRLENGPDPKFDPDRRRFGFGFGF